MRWDSVSVRLSCWGLLGDYDCGPFPASVTIPRAEFRLADATAPRVSAPTGALAGSAPVRGIASLAFQASDVGGGVYRAALSVDGAEVSRQVVDPAGGTCADVESDNDDPYEFGGPQPCPLAAQGSVPFDTASLQDGSHAIALTVEDAAGNEVVAHSGTIQTHNAPVATTLPAIGGEARVGAQLSAGVGTWDGAPDAVDQRWLRCDAQGANCTFVAGATGPAYPLDASDAYHRMRVEVTAANDSGVATARSEPSALIADEDGRTAPPAAPGGRDPQPRGPDPRAGDDDPPAPGGIVGLVNPLADLPGRVPNGDQASGGARVAIAIRRRDGGTARRVRSQHGRRWTIAGRLTDAAGAPISHAHLGAAWRVAGRSWVARRGVTTGADGRFAYVLPPGPSRAVRFAYFPFSDSSAVVLSNVVQVDAQAPLSIAATPRHVTGEREVRLSGRVGGPVGAAGSVRVPRSGLLVTLQGHQAGWGWRTFRTVRTDRRGQWSTSYRFRLSSGRFGFRAVVPAQAGFPFASSRSRGAFVTVS